MAAMPEPPRNPVPRGWLAVNEETNCFEVHLESNREVTPVANYSFSLYGTVENGISDTQYIVVKVKYLKEIKKNMGDMNRHKV